MTPRTAALTDDEIAAKVAEMNAAFANHDRTGLYYLNWNGQRIKRELRAAGVRMKWDRKGFVTEWSASQ